MTGLVQLEKETDRNPSAFYNKENQFSFFHSDFQQKIEKLNSKLKISLTSNSSEQAKNMMSKTIDFSKTGFSINDIKSFGQSAQFENMRFLSSKAFEKPQNDQRKGNIPQINEFSIVDNVEQNLSLSNFNQKSNLSIFRK